MSLVSYMSLGKRSLSPSQMNKSKLNDNRLECLAVGLT